jgi:hypothetical protein
VTSGDENTSQKNQFAITTAFETERFSMALSGKNMQMRTLAGTGTMLREIK